MSDTIQVMPSGEEVKMTGETFNCARCNGTEALYCACCGDQAPDGSVKVCPGCFGDWLRSGRPPKAVSPAEPKGAVFQRASIGRIVRYCPFGDEYTSELRPAIITKVLDEETQTCLLFVIDAATGCHFSNQIPYADTPTSGHWSWPPRQ